MPRTAGIGVCLAFLLLLPCPGQSPPARSGDAQTEWELSDAPIKPLVKERILASLIDAHKGEDTKDALNATLRHSKVHYVRLDPRGRSGVEVNTGNPWCGATGNCEMFLFDSKTGAQLMRGGGWDDGFRATMHHGVFDFYTRENTSAASGVRREYQFDGKVYQEVSTYSGSDY